MNNFDVAASTSTTPIDEANFLGNKKAGRRTETPKRCPRGGNNEVAVTHFSEDKARISPGELTDLG
jgi:hypothetical protein